MESKPLIDGSLVKYNMASLTLLLGSPVAPNWRHVPPAVGSDPNVSVWIRGRSAVSVGRTPVGVGIMLWV